MSASEFSLIYRYFAGLGAGAAVDLGVGDDCAIVRLAAGERLATSVDTMVEGRHFFADSFPEDIGYRAVSVAASDLAAMGARPLGMTLALTLPEADDFWLHSFSQGVAQASSQYQLPLIGGDTTSGSLTISVQVLGSLPQEHALLRSGAQPGDEVYVSGTLGDAAGALAFLAGDWQPEPEHGEYLLDRFSRPHAQLELGAQLLFTASAAIDVSDGLLADAGHMAAASGVKIVVDPGALPLSPALASHDSPDTVQRWALSGGDDYQLCFCLPAGSEPPAGVTRIGRVEVGAGVDCGAAIDFPTGYQHFRGA